MSVLSQYSQVHNEAMVEQCEVLSGIFAKLGSVSNVPKEIDRPSKGLRSTVPGVVLQYGSVFTTTNIGHDKTQPVFRLRCTFIYGEA
ncbi:hypothetical protein [Brevibacillus reuszeri]|uniref:hypothetical protein n=1 Tax=Brevibacillus reuszeri TaxID=54915 RepID=UPI0013DEEC6B|nr:hypothetical protein [Brevibacillus reuszeri]